MVENGLPERVGRIEQKLDDVSAAMTAASKQADERFRQVDERFRQVDERFQQMDERFQQMDERFKQMDERFQQVDQRFEKLEGNLEQRFRDVQEHFVEQRKYVEFAYERLDRRMTDGFSRLETKINLIIRAQARPKTAPTRRRSRPAKRRR